MSDWQPGDLAECVVLFDETATFEIRPAERVSPGPVKGLVYTVIDVVMAYDVFDRESVGLVLAEIRPPHPLATSFNAQMFRKITPPAADEFDREVIELMTGKPVPA